MGYEVMGNGETVREFDSVKGPGKKREGPRGLTGHLMYMCMGKKTESKINGV